MLLRSTYRVGISGTQSRLGFLSLYPRRHVIIPSVHGWRLLSGVIERPSSQDNNEYLGRFSMDLVVNTKRHMKFLQMLHANGTTLKNLSVESLRRYKDLWLPFVGAQQKKHAQMGQGVVLIPPSDVAWLWHCHRLAPRHYVRYMEETFVRGGNVEDARILLDQIAPFTFQRGKNIVHVNAKSQGLSALTMAGINVRDEEKACEVTRDLWSNMYPSEPFFLQPTDKTSTGSMPDFCVGEFDLLASAQRQKAFLWQVSGSKYQDNDFLKQGVSNYAKFLRLRSLVDKNQVLVPTYQIDLFWHTHMLSSIKSYEEDCKNICGSAMNHNDAMNDRSEGSDLNQAFAATRKAWKEAYGEEYEVDGGMYRGEPPTEYFQKEWVWNQPRKSMCKIDGTGTTTLDGSQPLLPAPARHPVPRKKDYIFGQANAGCAPAYYHILTGEAYDILADLLSRRISRLRQDIKAAEGQLFDSITGKSAKLGESLREHLDAARVFETRMATILPLEKTHPIIQELMLFGTGEKYIPGDDIIAGGDGGVDSLSTPSAAEVSDDGMDANNLHSTPLSATTKSDDFEDQTYIDFEGRSPPASSNDFGANNSSGGDGWWSSGGDDSGSDSGGSSCGGSGCGGGCGD